MSATIKAPAAEAPGQIMGTLAIMGFAAEDNLRRVARALGNGDIAALASVAERNAKQPRLRAEIEEQVAAEMAHASPGTQEFQKLVLASRLAIFFEGFGARTVEIAELCRQLLRESSTGRLADVRKLIEHAVYTTDRAATGFVESDLEMAQAALKEESAAQELYTCTVRGLSHLGGQTAGARPRIDLLSAIADKAHGLVEEAGRFVRDIIVYLQAE